MPRGCAVSGTGSTSHTVYMFNRWSDSLTAAAVMCTRKMSAVLKTVLYALCSPQQISTSSTHRIPCAPPRAAGRTRTTCSSPPCRTAPSRRTLKRRSPGITDKWSAAHPFWFAENSFLLKNMKETEKSVDGLQQRWNFPAGTWLPGAELRPAGAPTTRPPPPSPCHRWGDFRRNRCIKTRDHFTKILIYFLLNIVSQLWAVLCRVPPKMWYVFCVGKSCAISADEFDRVSCPRFGARWTVSMNEPHPLEY